MKSRLSSNSWAQSSNPLASVSQGTGTTGRYRCALLSPWIRITAARKFLILNFFMQRIVSKYYKLRMEIQ
jgi:hypothetical protein